MIIYISIIYIIIMIYPSFGLFNPQFHAGKAVKPWVARLLLYWSSRKRNLGPGGIWCAWWPAKVITWCPLEMVVKWDLMLVKPRNLRILWLVYCTSYPLKNCKNKSWAQENLCKSGAGWSFSWSLENLALLASPSDQSDQGTSEKRRMECCTIFSDTILSWLLPESQSVVIWVWVAF